MVAVPAVKAAVLASVEWADWGVELGIVAVCVGVGVLVLWAFSLLMRK